MARYESLAEFSIALSNNTKDLDKAFRNSPAPKQMGSFNVTVSSLREMLQNIKAITKLKEEIKMFPMMDRYAMEENKDAKKAKAQIDAIRDKIDKSYENLKKEFVKQLSLAGKQCKEVTRAIKDKEDKDRFFASSRDFSVMVYGIESSNDLDFLNVMDDFSKLKQAQAHEEHKEKEERINNISSFNIDNTNSLQMALDNISSVLALTSESSLTKEVRKEVASIKKVLPPKVAQITKEALEHLRHSEHLILDLEQISEILNTTYRFVGKDGALQKLNNELNQLQVTLERALDKEKDRHSGMQSEQSNRDRQVDYATSAVKSYSDILTNNKNLEQEKIQIKANTHNLNKENSRLKQDIKDESKDKVDFESKQDYVSTQSSQNRIEENRQYISENEAYMASRLREKEVTTLPKEYTDMKKKLQSLSNLYKVENEVVHDMTTGGIKR